MPDLATSERPAKGKGRLKREATEAAIVEAFDRVVQRSGLRNVGVNEVIKEAGIGKSLLYRYFGGLPGLVQAWGETHQIWPDSAELSHLSEQIETVGAAEQLTRMVLHHANSMRNHPLRVELLADEFMTPTVISDALTGIRQQLGAEHKDIFAHNKELQNHHTLMMILMAAASYLAMRATRSPWYMGENIGSDEGWQHMLEQIVEIIEKVVPESERASGPTSGAPQDQLIHQ